MSNTEHQIAELKEAINQVINVEGKKAHIQARKEVQELINAALEEGLSNTAIIARIIDWTDK